MNNFYYGTNAEIAKKTAVNVSLTFFNRLQNGGGSKFYCMFVTPLIRLPVYQGE